jgi:ketosteroid isomerase-like protein
MIELLKMIFGGHLERGAIAMTVERMICEGDYLVEQATGEAKTLGGEPYDNTYCRIWHFRDGKIDSLLEFMDTELARRCLWT